LQDAPTTSPATVPGFLRLVPVHATGPDGLLWLALVALEGIAQLDDRKTNQSAMLHFDSPTRVCWRW